MTRIRPSKDCGNSPKNRFVQDVAIFLEAGPGDPGLLSEDVIWSGAEGGLLEGRLAVQAWLAERPKPSMIIIEHAFSHGKAGAASGEVMYEDGASRRFSHMLDFTSVKAERVAQIKSYA